MKKNTTDIAVLTRKTIVYAAGTTGQAAVAGWLAAGVLVRNVLATGAVHPLDGLPWYRFEASDDGGNSWFTRECCGEPKTRGGETVEEHD